MSPLLLLGGAGVAAYFLFAGKKGKGEKGPGAGVYQLVVEYPAPLTQPQIQAVREEYSRWFASTNAGELINVQQVGNQLRIDAAFNTTPAIEPRIQPFKLGGVTGTLVSVAKIA
jgi:hypothetical protein